MMREFASGGRYLPDSVVGDLAAIIGLISDLIKEGHKQGEFKDMDPLTLHLMLIGGISYIKASGPVLSKYAQLMKAPPPENGAENEFDFLDKIENIILSALDTRKNG